MNVQHFKYAVEVDKTGSISAAAENLYMNQPNLSKAIKELEESLGIKIFQRTSRGVSATRQGKEFLGYARSILAQLEEVESKYRLDGGRRKRFSISVPRVSYIAYAFTSFVSKLPTLDNVEIRYFETNSMRAVMNILENGYTLGIVRFPSTQEEYYQKFLSENGLDYNEINEFMMRVIMSTRHPLAMQETVSVAELEHYIELTHDDPAVPHVPSGKVVPLTNTSKRIFIQERGIQFDLLNRVAGTYMWVSPMPKDILVRNELVQRECSDEGIPYKDVLIYLSGYKFTPIEKNFLAILEEVKKGAQR